MMGQIVLPTPGTARAELAVDDGGETGPEGKAEFQANRVPVGGDAAVSVPSFAAFYDQNRDALVAAAYGLSGSRWAAEELAHDAFVAALRRWDEVSGYDNPAAWITRVVVNRAASRWRRLLNESKAMLRLGGQRRAPLPELEPQDDEFWAAVRALPRRQAQTITLQYLEDRPVSEIATVLDCAEATVRVHLHRGRQALTRSLGGGQQGAADHGAAAGTASVAGQPGPGGGRRAADQLGDADRQNQHNDADQQEMEP